MLPWKVLMICLISFFNKIRLPAIVLLTAFLAGCAGVEQSSGVAGKEKNMRIAFLPLENLSGTRSPLNEIADSFRAILSQNGFDLVDAEKLEQFRKKYRMRYTGGVSSVLSDALQKEMGADAIFITSLEAYQERKPPQISLVSRLVTSGRQPEILWIDSVGLSGDEDPGILDLKRIKEPGPLMEKAITMLVDSLVSHLRKDEQVDDSWWSSFAFSSKSDADVPSSKRISPNKKYIPYDFFRSPVVKQANEYSIAVIPFRDLAVRKNAGKIVTLHYVRELFQQTKYRIFEPGLVREELLRFRAIMPAGPSLAVADLITSEESLGVDLVLSGKVFDYQNRSNNPKMDFSVQVIEKNTREVVFGARTFSTGMDGVYFYDVGRVFTAHELLEEMSRVTVLLLDAPYPPWNEPDNFIADAGNVREREIADKRESIVPSDIGAQKKITLNK